MSAPLESRLESEAGPGIAATGERRVCLPGLDSDDVRIDPEFEGLIPPLSAGELAALQRSLEAEGCRDALVVWKGRQILVDGHNRIRWCREKGCPFAVIEKEFADREEVKAYLVREQLGRRNLSPVAESYLRGKRYLELRHQGRKEPTSGHSDPKRVSEQLAEEFKVGEKTIRRDGAFAAAVDAIVAECGAEARNLILSRETGLARGGVRRLAALEPEAERKFVEELKATGKAPRQVRKVGRGTLAVPREPKALVRALLEKLAARELAAVSRALGEALAERGEERGGGENRKNGRSRRGNSRKGDRAKAK
jgi:hypothetical protein